MTRSNPDDTSKPRRDRPKKPKRAVPVEPIRVKPALTPRTCLRCQNQFPSTGAGNRICAKCTENTPRVSRMDLRRVSSDIPNHKAELEED